jgi:hypothetical protein
MYISQFLYVSALIFVFFHQFSDFQLFFRRFIPCFSNNRKITAQNCSSQAGIPAARL